MKPVENVDWLEARVLAETCFINFNFLSIPSLFVLEFEVTVCVNSPQSQYCWCCTYLSYMVV